MANDDPDYIAGDLVFVVRELPHPVFVRKENNLHVKTNIELWEAVTQFSRKIYHFDNHTVEIQGIGVTQPGTIKKIQFEGMPVHEAGSQRGDFYAEITVKYPQQLTDAQKIGNFLYKFYSSERILRQE